MSDSSIKAANSGFAFRLFGELARRQPDKNIFISPLSVSLALAVALGGAAGATRDAIASSLGLEGMEDDAIDRAFGALLDALGALDTRTQAQVLSLLRELQARMGVTVLFISHDLHTVSAMSREVIVMRAGRVVERGAPEQLFNAPVEDYTRELVAAVPRRDPRQRTFRKFTAK